MRGITVSKAADICGGVLSTNYGSTAEIGRVIIDSRSVMPGDMFVAYRGEKVDGRDYIPAAFASGAVCCLTDSMPEDVSRPAIVVDDVQEALERICTEYRKSLTLPIVGITGSVGKTSAKEMIASVLGQRMNVLKTDKNLNNQIGVPMTLSRIEEENDAAVIEMGISGFGEMSQLARMVKPDIAVFTMIGHAHLEFLHDLDGVLKAKTEMLDYMKPDAVVILNGDDEKLKTVKCRQKKISFGLNAGCDIRAENIELITENTTKCDIVSGERHISAVIPAFGRHMVYAALEGAAVGIAMGMTDAEIEKGIAAFEIVGRRAAVVNTGYLTVIDDSYNANPDSVRSGIDSISRLDGRHVCILGDMLELGNDTERMHREIGEYALKRGIDLVIGCGELAENISSGADKSGVYFRDKCELIKALPRLLRRGDTVLIKASRGMRFEEISEAVKSIGAD